jgi:hypothetical protein
MGTGVVFRMTWILSCGFFLELATSFDGVRTNCVSPAVWISNPPMFSLFSACFGFDSTDVGITVRPFDMDLDKEDKEDKVRGAAALEELSAGGVTNELDAGTTAIVGISTAVSVGFCRTSGM